MAYRVLIKRLQFFQSFDGTTVIKNHNLPTPLHKGRQLPYEAPPWQVFCLVKQKIFTVRLVPNNGGPAPASCLFTFISRICVLRSFSSSFMVIYLIFVCKSGIITCSSALTRLVHRAGVVLTGLALADALILQTRQAGQHVHGRDDALAVQVTGEDDLTLGDVTGQVRDRVGLVVLGHGQDRNHGDRAGLADAAACALVERGKVGVQVAGVAAAAGDFLLGRGDLTQRLGVVGDIWRGADQRRRKWAASGRGPAYSGRR